MSQRCPTLQTSWELRSRRTLCGEPQQNDVCPCFGEKVFHKEVFQKESETGSLHKANHAAAAANLFSSTHELFLSVIKTPDAFLPKCALSISVFVYTQYKFSALGADICSQRFRLPARTKGALNVGTWCNCPQPRIPLC